MDVYRSGEALLVADKSYDIYLLDIQMLGVSGIQAARALREKQETTGTAGSVIIFITALKEYMQDAFDVSALHYLVKPLDEQKFAAVFSRALKDIKRRDEAAGKHIVIKSGNSRYKIFIREIAYVESRDRKNIIHTHDGAIEYYGRLRELESALGGGFFRCHRSYIVNMAHIVRYNADEITLNNGSVAYIAQKKYHAFVKAFMLFARNGGAL